MAKIWRFIGIKILKILIQYIIDLKPDIVHDMEARIEKEGLTERAIILCKFNKSLLESSISVGKKKKKSLYYLMNLCIYQTSRFHKM